MIGVKLSCRRGRRARKVGEKCHGYRVDKVEKVEKRGDKSGKLCIDREAFFGDLSDFSVISDCSDFFLSSPD
jgi:hypothetical protein